MGCKITVSDATYNLIIECEEILHKKDGIHRSPNMTLAEVCLFYRQALKETLEIMNDKKLMEKIREGREKGSKSSPYKPLVEGDE